METLINWFFNYMNYRAENPNSSYYFVALWIGIIVISWILGIIRKRKNRQRLHMLVKQKREDKIEMMAEAMRRSGIKSGINIENSFNQFGDGNNQNFKLQ